MYRYLDIFIINVYNVYLLNPFIYLNICVYTYTCTYTYTYNFKESNQSIYLKRKID